MVCDLFSCGPPDALRCSHSAFSKCQVNNDCRSAFGDSPDDHRARIHIVPLVSLSPLHLDPAFRFRRMGLRSGGLLLGFLAPGRGDPTAPRAFLGAFTIVDRVGPCLASGGYVRLLTALRSSSLASDLPSSPWVEGEPNISSFSEVTFFIEVLLACPFETGRSGTPSQAVQVASLNLLRPSQRPSWCVSRVRPTEDSRRASHHTRPGSLELGGVLQLLVLATLPTSKSNKRVRGVLCRVFVRQCVRVRTTTSTLLTAIYTTAQVCAC